MTFTIHALSLSEKRSAANFLLSNLDGVILETMNKGHLLNPNGMPKFGTSSNIIQSNNK